MNFVLIPTKSWSLFFPSGRTNPGIERFDNIRWTFTFDGWFLRGDRFDCGTNSSQSELISNGKEWLKLFFLFFKLLFLCQKFSNVFWKGFFQGWNLLFEFQVLLKFRVKHPLHVNEIVFQFSQLLFLLLDVSLTFEQQQLSFFLWLHHHSSVIVSQDIVFKCQRVTLVFVKLTFLLECWDVDRCSDVSRFLVRRRHL